MSERVIKRNKGDVVYFEYTSWGHRYKEMQDDGTVVYKKIKGFKTKEEAKESYKKYNEKFKEQQKQYFLTTSKDIMFKDYLIYWFENIYCPRVENNTNTVGAYIIYDLIIPSIEYDLKVNLTTTDYLNQIIENASKITPSGGRSAKFIIQIAMKDAYVDGYINYKVVDGLKEYKKTRKKIVIFNKKQIAKFLSEAVKTNWYLEILLGLFCGLRRGEILGLKFSDVDFQENTLEIKRQLVRKCTREKQSSKIVSYEIIESHPKTEESVRTIKVPDLIMEEIIKRQQLISVQKNLLQDKYIDNDYISCREDGQCHSLTSLNVIIHQICDKISLPRIRTHGLRHMCATLLLENGVSLTRIAAFLGHSSIHTTFEYYCEVMDEKDNILSYINDTFATIGGE